MQVLEGLRKALSEYNIVKIQEEHYDDVYHLQSENMIYFQYTNEYPLKYKNVISKINDVPSKVKDNQKYYIGFYLEDTLIAIMEYIDGYPSDNVYWINLLMLDINYQGLGIGTKIMNAFIESSHKDIQVECLIDNKEEYSFWSKFGFQKIKHTSKKEENKIMMQKKISEHEF